MSKETEVNLNVKVPLDLRDRFQKVTKLNDSDTSKEIRKFMKEYLGKHSQLALKV